MIPHIICDTTAPVKRGSDVMRIDRLKAEMERQGITEYRLWPAIHIANAYRRTAISQAHKQIVRWAMQEGLPEVLIFEDDIRFPAPDGFQYFLSKKPKVDYDLYLVGVYRGDIAEDYTTKRFTGMTGYIITEKFYDIFLGVDERLDIDGAMAHLGLFYVCWPFSAIQHKGFSINMQEEIDHNYLLIGKAIRGLEVTDKKGMSEERIITDLPPFS